MSYAGGMTSDSEEALGWEGDEDPASAGAALPSGSKRRADHGRRVDRSARTGPVAESESESDEDSERPALSNTMLLITGVVGGVYLLYAVGWVIGGLRLQPLARFFVADAMFLPWFVLAVASPLLWFLAVWILTRGRAAWVRASFLLLGVVLLVPWPFVTVGVIGV